MSAKRVLAVGAAVVAVLAAALYFVNPWGPVILLASIAIQLPVIVVITKSAFTNGYRERAFLRREQYQKDGDAGAWLAAEEREAASVGYKYWSKGARAQCALNRAAALAALNRPNEAAVLLAEMEEKRLPAAERARFEEVAGLVRRDDDSG